MHWLIYINKINTTVSIKLQTEKKKSELLFINEYESNNIKKSMQLNHCKPNYKTFPKNKWWRFVDNLNSIKLYDNLFQN